VSEPEFLTLDQVREIHADQLRVYGGASGLRDLELLRSAIAMPETRFDGEYQANHHGAAILAASRIRVNSY
jgi:prophage maintenance system killer protein